MIIDNIYVHVWVYIGLNSELEIKKIEFLECNA